MIACVRCTRETADVGKRDIPRRLSVFPCALLPERLEMTRYSVQRFRAAVLHMYLRIAVIVTLPLSVLYYVLAITPSRGLAAFAFALFALWIKWRAPHDSEESLRYA